MTTASGPSLAARLACALLVASLAAPPAAAAPKRAPKSAPAAAQAPDARTASALSARLLGELNDPRALADLLRLSEAAEREADLRLFAVTLESAAQARKLRPDVKALALHLLAQVRRAQGQLPQARAIADGLGFVRAWALIGPFDNDGRRGHAAVFAPETAGVVFGTRYAGKEHEVEWRTLPDVAPLGTLELGSAISPRQDVTVYAATTLTADKAQGAILHLGGSGATKVWLNGALVHEDANQHPARLDQHAVPVRLAAGRNALLVKLSHGTGALALLLRVADEREQPLLALAKAAKAPAASDESFRVQEPAGAPIAGEARRRRSQRPPPRPLDAVAELQARAEKSPADARAQEDLALVLAARRPDDDTERLALRAQEKAAAAAPGDPAIELRLFGFEDRDSNKRRQALERALEKHPGDPALWEALAQHRLERGESWKALEAAEKAQTGGVLAKLTWIRALDAAGSPGLAQAERLELGRKNPEDARAQKAEAQAKRRLGRAPEARALLEQVLRLRFDDGDARAELTSLLLDTGDLEGALARLAEAIALAPGALSLRVRAAELLSQNGRTGPANAAFAQALALSPDDPDLYESLGRHHLRGGAAEAALDAFNRSLALRPQNPSLRELVRSVKPEERYAAPYLVDAPALARNAAGRRVPGNDAAGRRVPGNDAAGRRVPGNDAAERRVPGNDAPGQDGRPAAGSEDLEILADVTVVKVFPNGLSSRTHQLVVRALTPRGVEQARVQSVQFAPDRQVVRIERARIVRPDGQVLESKGESERTLSEPWYDMWYDLRARIVPFTQLAPGDVLEFVSRLDDVGTNFFSDYFGDFVQVQGTSNKRLVDYVLLGPPGRTFFTNAAPLPGLAKSETLLPDGGLAVRFTARDVPRVVPEPGMPGPSEVFAWIHVSTFADWDSVGRFYWGLVKDQLQPTADVRRAAEEAVRGVPEADEPGRIRAVYHYVLAKTRYVALEFGINSYKPYPVETILSRAFGDCKDKASLMYALLQALHIDSRLVLLRMKRLGALQDLPASLAVFNHAILYVPKYELFLDGTAEFHGAKELPGDDRGAEVLIVEPSGAGSRLLRAPAAVPADNTEQSLAHLKVLAGGSAELTLQLRSQGAWTPPLRQAFESPDERKQRAEELLSRGSFPGVKVTAVEASDPLALEQPFALKLSALVPSFAVPGAGGSLRLAPFGRRPRTAEAWAQLSRRVLPLKLPAAQTTSVEHHLELPAGLVPRLPEPLAEQGPFGSWSVGYALEGPGGNTVVARLTQELTGGQITQDRYADWRSFLERLDAAVARPVEAAQAGGGGL